MDFERGEGGTGGGPGVWAGVAREVGGAPEGPEDLKKGLRVHQSADDVIYISQRCVACVSIWKMWDCICCGHSEMYYADVAHSYV